VRNRFDDGPSDGTVLANQLEMPTRTLVASSWLLALMVSCGGAPPEEPRPMDLSQAPVAHPEQDGTPRLGVIDLDGAPTQVELREVDGELILDSDIVLPRESVTLLDEAVPGESAQGLAARKAFALWPKGVVPYRIADKLSATMKTRIKSAIAHWEAKTPLRFVKRNQQADWVLFTSGSGCSAMVGRAGGKQLVRLSSLCSKGAVIHEIGHTAGLWHEQSRTDRGKYIKIRWSNISAGMEFNFQTYVAQGFDGRNVGTYDTHSVMHYGSYAFSKNGKPTIVRLDGSKIEPAKVLSTRDIKGVAKIYAPLL